MASNEMDGLLAEANNCFGLKLHLELAQEQTNVFFSPFSVSVALSMLLRAARGVTADEIKHVLGFENVKLDDNRIHHAFHQLLSVIAENQELYTLAVANAIMAQRDFAIHPEYILDLKKLYKAMVMDVDFATESSSAVAQINQWVSENTKGKIPNVLQSLDPATVVVLLNAVYFKGTWQQQFDPKSTYDGIFYNKGAEDQEKTVPLMYMSERVPFVEKEAYKALELPYQGNHIAMLLLLPKEMSGLRSLEKSLSTGFVQKIRKELAVKEVEVTLPKIHLEYSKELLPILQTLGISSVFQRGANLKGLSDSNDLLVSNVIHKAVLDVNEEGSEAAAVTVVSVMLCSLRFTPQFRADHPFLFVIYDKRNNLILFMGRVLEL